MGYKAVIHGGVVTTYLDTLWLDSEPEEIAEETGTCWDGEIGEFYETPFTGNRYAYIHLYAPELPKGPSTEEVLASMLTENTGIHMMDSGREYGRHWQQNQGRDFASESAATVQFGWHGEIDFTHNVYHWLDNRVDYDHRLQRMYDHFVGLFSDEDTSHFEDVYNFVEWRKEHGKVNRDDQGILVVNTYNEPNLLSQDFQYTSWMDEDFGECFLLQIHGGADARGGYTAPKAFTGKEGYYSLAMVSDGTIVCQGSDLHFLICRDCGNRRQLSDEDFRRPQIGYCEKCTSFNTFYQTERVSHSWTTDDACHWYAEGAAGLGAGKQLQDYETKEVIDDQEWEAGFLCYTEDGDGSCPCCGARLEASEW